jgi:tetratricopeptide (TPR) repeat protein
MRRGVLYGDPTYRYLEPLPSAPAVVEAATTLPAPPQRRDRSWQGWLSSLSRKKPLAVGIGVLLLLCLGGLVAQLLRPRTPLEASPLRLAYQTLEQGDWQKAETLFQQLTASPAQRAKSQAYAGLGAVALSRGNYQQALDLVQQAETLAPDLASSHLVRGHIFLQQGKTAEATAAYNLALQKPLVFSWQQAVAYDRLGRIYAAQGETSKALEHYDKAISQQGDMAVVYANKGYLLERLGQSQEALPLYQQALHLMPDDPLTTTLLRDVQRRQQLAQDQEQQQQIDRLVDELVQAYKDGAGSTPEDS